MINVCGLILQRFTEFCAPFEKMILHLVRGTLILPMIRMLCEWLALFAPPSHHHCESAATHKFQYTGFTILRFKRTEKSELPSHLFMFFCVPISFFLSSFWETFGKIPCILQPIIKTLHAQSK